ncbi:hypothetical protein LEP1GSC058_2735 [Leptospira fainei serovar Hurstbridge str. BUT 6]|uniref:Uncharacterized protein n=1 Tax=Leptospira fainei serovar Hurstbridge str. BUT 6 TaxID=1193011 RepID=S3UTC6_9LEPT|nr:hypothetical protein LEP1GSC058_2735 [Leptospira fainei serovar Hurstbridge str. BUT 6]
MIRLDNASIVNSNSIRLRTILSRTFYFLRIVFSFRRGRKMGKKSLFGLRKSSCPDLFGKNLGLYDVRIKLEKKIF